MVRQLVHYVGIKDGMKIKIVIRFLVVLFYVKYKLVINALKIIVLVRRLVIVGTELLNQGKTVME